MGGERERGRETFSCCGCSLCCSFENGRGPTCLFLDSCSLFVLPLLKDNLFAPQSPSSNLNLQSPIQPNPTKPNQTQPNQTNPTQPNLTKPCPLITLGFLIQMPNGLAPNSFTHCSRFSCNNGYGYGLTLIDRPKNNRDKWLHKVFML